MSTGIGVKIPHYREGKPWKKGMSSVDQEECCSIIITKPDSITSANETEATMNMSSGSHKGKTKSELIVKRKGDTDTSQCITNKSLCKASMVEGNLKLGNSKSLRPKAIWSVKPEVAWMRDASCSSAMAGNGQRHTCTQDFNSHCGSTPASENCRVGLS